MSCYCFLECNFFVFLSCRVLNVLAAIPYLILPVGSEPDQGFPNSPPLLFSRPLKRAHRNTERLKGSLLLLESTLPGTQNPEMVSGFSSTAAWILWLGVCVWGTWAELCVWGPCSCSKPGKGVGSQENG